MPSGLTAFDLPDWETAAIAVLVALICVLALRRSASRWRGVLLRIAAVVIALTATFCYFRLTADREQAAELRALQARQADLAARALTPGSPLACLDGDAGEIVETACEKAIFSKPETTAAAVVYVTARLSLLADTQRLAEPDDEELAASLAGLRRALTLDRYGIAAHVLAIRDGCNAEACRAFSWVEDASALKANLKAHAFDSYVARYASDWNKIEEPAKAPAPPDVPQANAVTPPAASSFANRYDFPSAASIPPVSIMNKEPPRPPDADVASTPSSTPGEQPTEPAEHMPMPPKRPQTQGIAPR